MLGDIEMQTSRRAAGAIAMASVLAVGLLAATPASAAKPKGPKTGDYVFDFMALCTDCTATAGGAPEYGEGVLKLKNVIDLSALTLGNFVDFTYSSNLVGDIDIDDPTVFTGNFSDLSQASVHIVGGSTPVEVCDGKKCRKPKGSVTWEFETSTSFDDGPEWSLGKGKGGKKPKNADYGDAYSWTAGSVPEPAAWALMIAGFGLAGVRLRSERRRPARTV